MRLDKFLKVSRVIKRRTVAQDACGTGRVLVNGAVATSGKQIKIGDEITIEFGKEPLTIKVVALSETVRKEDADSLYEVVIKK